MAPLCKYTQRLYKCKYGCPLDSNEEFRMRMTVAREYWRVLYWQVNYSHAKTRNTLLPAETQSAEILPESTEWSWINYRFNCHHQMQYNCSVGDVSLTRTCYIWNWNYDLLLTFALQPWICWMLDNVYKALRLCHVRICITRQYLGIIHMGNMLCHKFFCRCQRMQCVPVGELLSDAHRKRC